MSRQMGDGLTTGTVFTTTRQTRSEMATEDSDSAETPMDRVMADLRRELVRRAAERDRDDHRDVYDALADE